eukprot:g9671.t1
MNKRGEAICPEIRLWEKVAKVPNENIARFFQDLEKDFPELSRKFPELSSKNPGGAQVLLTRETLYTSRVGGVHKYAKVSRCYRCRVSGFLSYHAVAAHVIYLLPCLLVTRPHSAAAIADPASMLPYLNDSGNKPGGQGRAVHGPEHYPCIITQAPLVSPCPVAKAKALGVCLNKQLTFDEDYDMQQARSLLFSWSLVSQMGKWVVDPNNPKDPWGQYVGPTFGMVEFAERWNGRLAMIAVAGIAAQELRTGEGFINHLKMLLLGH